MFTVRIILHLTPILFFNFYFSHRSGHSNCQTLWSFIVKGEETHFLIVTGVAIAVVTERKLMFPATVVLSTIEGFICTFIILHEKFLQFDWLRSVVFQLNLKYLHVKITNHLWVVV